MSNDIEMFKGDNKTFEVTVIDAASVVVDLTGAEIVFTVKQSSTSTTTIIQRKNIAAGGDASQIEDSDPTNGIFKIHIIPANTSSQRASKYVYDVQITLSGKVSTAILDSFILKQDVTN